LATLKLNITTPDVEAYYDVELLNSFILVAVDGFVLDIYQINIETMIYRLQ
jgi:hypothetical protein